MQKAISTHKPPSRRRYEASHPTVTIRVSPEVHQKLMNIRQTTGKSLGDILREAVGVQEASARSAYQRGYQAAEALYAVRWKCRVCGEDCTANDEAMRKRAAQHLADIGGIHSACATRAHQVQEAPIIASYAFKGPSGDRVTKIVRQRPDGSTYVTPA